jgi:hypothetical protein
MSYYANFLHSFLKELWLLFLLLFLRIYFRIWIEFNYQYDLDNTYIWVEPNLVSTQFSMIDMWINLGEGIVPKCPFEMPIGAYKHVNITHTQTKIKNIYCYSNSSFFHFGLVASTSSSCFSIAKACRNHQVLIQTIRRPLQSLLT